MKTLRSILVGGSLVAASFVATAALAQTNSPPLDYARTIQEGSIVFVPYIGMHRGPVFYAEYEQVPTTTSNTPSLKRLFVNLMPTAHVDNLYNAFIQSNGITDAKVLAVPAVQACQPMANILQLLAGVPAPYKPRILGGNYPILCTLSVYFLPEQEQAVRALIAAEPVIALHASVPLCAPNSPRLDNTRIIAELQARGVVSVESDGTVTGNAWKLFYGSAALARDRPALFVTSDPQEGWTVFVKQFTVDPVADTASLDGRLARVPPYICVPDPLDLNF
jgi:hypothetical protein